MLWNLCLSSQGNGGGLSPRKLRSMILGAEKRRNLDHEKEEEDDEQHHLDSTFSLRSQVSHIHHSAGIIIIIIILYYIYINRFYFRGKLFVEMPR